MQLENGSGPERDVVKLRLGGMALRNGLLVHGPSKWAVAVRTGSGETGVASGDKPRFRGRASQLPAFAASRGLVRPSP